MSQYLAWITSRTLVDAPFVLNKSEFAQAAAGEFGPIGTAPWDLAPSKN